MRVFRQVATPLTLLLLLAVLIGGAWWGYKNVIKPIPPAQASPCVTQKVGDKLTANKVTVNVYNGGYKQGLAGTVSKALKAKGYVIKHVDNTDERVKQTVIVGADVNNPEVKLVAANFKNATVKADQRADHTVDVLVGTEFAGMNPKAPNFIKVPGGEVCLPASKTPSATPTR